jgi:hypothetical protein
VYEGIGTEGGREGTHVARYMHALVCLMPSMHCKGSVCAGYLKLRLVHSVHMGNAIEHVILGVLNSTAQ